MSKLILAPMATISHEAFRRCVERFGGCDEYFTEMINASSLVNMGPFEKYYLLSGPVPEKIVWQLTGWEAESFAKAAKIIAPLGGIGIDLNMGCSAPQIYKTGAGIAWMTKPLEETALAVRKVRTVLDEYEKSTGIHRRLSVKCRLGTEKWTENTFFAFTDMLVNEGVESITLHARTQKEKYRTNPKYSMNELLTLRYKGKINTVLNGNIKDKQSFDFAKQMSPSSDSFMVARQAAAEPWIFALMRMNKNESLEIDRKQVALDFIDDVTKYQPQEFWKTRIQRFFSYYCQQFSFGHYFATKMMNYKSIEDSITEINDYFNRQENDRFKTIKGWM